MQHAPIELPCQHVAIGIFSTGTLRLCSGKAMIGHEFWRVLGTGQHSASGTLLHQGWFHAHDTCRTHKCELLEMPQKTMFEAQHGKVMKP